MPVTTPIPHSSWRPRHAAIDRLVPRHDRRLRRVARSYGLSAWDVDDVVQATWLQYLEHGHALREPAALGAWLETTARRLSLRVLQRRVREQLTDDRRPVGRGRRRRAGARAAGHGAPRAAVRRPRRACPTASAG